MADGFDAEYLPAHGSGEAWDVLGLGQVRLLPAGRASHMLARPLGITGTRPGGGSQHRCSAILSAQAMVDFSACVDDQFLQQLDVEKGSRR